MTPGEPVVITPSVTPGNSPITGVTFDNGKTSKTVPGEGTWTVKLVDGKPQFTFTPQDGFVGVPTPQKYTVTDANGLSASGTLTVTIKGTGLPVTGFNGGVLGGVVLLALLGGGALVMRRRGARA